MTVAVTPAGISGTGTGAVPLVSVTGDGSGDHTSTSSSFVSISAAYVLTIPATVGDVLEATASVDTTQNVNHVMRYTFGATNSPHIVLWSGAGNIHSVVVDHHTVTLGDISGGNATVTPKWRTNSGTMVMKNETGSFDRRPHFSVKNLGQ